MLPWATTGVNEIVNRIRYLSTDCPLLLDPRVGPPAVDVGEHVLPGQLGRVHRALVPSGAIRVRGDRSHTTADESGALRCVEARGCDGVAVGPVGIHRVPPV